VEIEDDREIKERKEKEKKVINAKSDIVAHTHFSFIKELPRGIQCRPKKAMFGHWAT